MYYYIFLIIYKLNILKKVKINYQKYIKINLKKNKKEMNKIIHLILK